MRHRGASVSTVQTQSDVTLSHIQFLAVYHTLIPYLVIEKVLLTPCLKNYIKNSLIKASSITAYGEEEGILYFVF